MTITDTPAQAPPAPRKPGVKAWAARIAGAVAAVALLAAGGLYALDRVDAAADRSAQAQAEATRQAAADQVQAIRQAAADQVEIFNQGVGNDNTRIDEANKSIRAANRMLDSMSADCFGYSVDGAIQQNGCFLQYIVQMLPHLIG